MAAPDATPPDPAPPDEAELRRAVARGLERYFAERRRRVDPFVDRHFSLAGSARLHKAALGWDVLRAPANLLLSGPQLGVRATGAVLSRLGARAAGARLRHLELQRRTDVARELDWLLTTELLELPCRQGERQATHDALAEAILEDPVLQRPLAALLEALGPAEGAERLRARLPEAMAEYAVTRAAAAEIATGLLTLGAGVAATGKLTPGVATLGPGLAAVLAQQGAVASFPLGSTLGGLWYAAFPAAASTALVAGVTGGLALAATGFAAFSGVVTDPLQRRLGLHRRRLLRLVDALERQCADPAAPAFAVHDHYVARLLDLFDAAGLAWRVLRGGL